LSAAADAARVAPSTYVADFGLGSVCCSVAAAVATTTVSPPTGTMAVIALTASQIARL